MYIQRKLKEREKERTRAMQKARAQAEQRVQQKSPSFHLVDSFFFLSKKLASKSSMFALGSNLGAILVIFALPSQLPIYSSSKDLSGFHKIKKNTQCAKQSNTQSVRERETERFYQKFKETERERNLVNHVMMWGLI